MKKIILIIIILIICGCSSNNKNIISKIELDNNNCKIISEIDNHSGFHGDGEYFAKIKCSNINKEELSRHWKKLPLSNSINEATNINHCDSKGCYNIYEKYNIPNIKNGYYYFLDRNSESKNKYDDTYLNDRHSHNYTLALLDKDNDIIYYYELDT